MVSGWLWVRLVKVSVEAFLSQALEFIFNSHQPFFKTFDTCFNVCRCLRCRLHLDMTAVDTKSEWRKWLLNHGRLISNSTDHARLAVSTKWVFEKHCQWWLSEWWIRVVFRFHCQDASSKSCETLINVFGLLSFKVGSASFVDSFRTSKINKKEPWLLQAVSFFVATFQSNDAMWSTGPMVELMAFARSCDFYKLHNLDHIGWSIKLDFFLALGFINFTSFSCCLFLFSLQLRGNPFAFSTILGIQTSWMFKLFWSNFALALASDRNLRFIV